MTGLLGPVEVRELADRLGIRPSKSLGQNFVHDPNTIRRIVRDAELADGETVLEVGPGLGSLTLGLLAVGARVTAVEVDGRLAAELPVTVARLAPDRISNLTVLHADALALRELAVPPPTALVANLPYNVAVPVLLNLLAAFDSLRHGLVLVQLEVADRLAAPPGSRVYGAPSAKLAWYGPARRIGLVSRSVFWPVPNVESGLVRFERTAPPAGADRNRVFTVVDAAFAQRRKMLRSALAGLFGSSAAAEAALVTARVPPTARGETLDVQAFARIADELPA